MVALRPIIYCHINVETLMYLCEFVCCAVRWECYSLYPFDI